MSEAALHGLHCRLIGGKREKAQHGTLRWRLPVALVSDATGQIVCDPDEAIQAAVRQVVAVFATTHSAFAVVQHCAAHRLPIPERLWHRASQGEVVWRPLRHARVLSMFHKPFSAGAYGYGRTMTRRRPLPGDAPRVQGDSRQVKRDEWPLLLRDHHPGSITWDQLHRQLAPLDENRTVDAAQRRGALRAGGALLQGRVVCGVCGRRLTGRSMPDGRRPVYVGAQLPKDCAGKPWQCIRGAGMDAAVAQLLVAALDPAHLTIALAALEHLDAQARAIEHPWQLRLERARYEVEQAKRRYQAVEPEHRLVARRLERDWNAKLTVLDPLERAYTVVAPGAAHHVSAAERQRIVD